MRNFCVILFGIGFVSLIYSQTRPIIGYDKVAWGSSVEDIRKAYDIGEDIELTDIFVWGNDPNIQIIEQENVSDSISRRIFYI
jgi:hypothetical protein